MAKLRVAWMVGGCAPGVRTITRSVLFHCTTWLTGFVACAIAGARFAAASTAAVVPASNMAFISDLTQLMRKGELSTRLKSLAASGDHPSRSVGKSAAALPMETATLLGLFRLNHIFRPRGYSVSLADLSGAQCKRPCMTRHLMVCPNNSTR
jgi:hypothetical protein